MSTSSTLSTSQPPADHRPAGSPPSWVDVEELLDRLTETGGDDPHRRRPQHHDLELPARAAHPAPLEHGLEMGGGGQHPRVLGDVRAARTHPPAGRPRARTLLGVHDRALPPGSGGRRAARRRPVSRPADVTGRLAAMRRLLAERARLRFVASALFAILTVGASLLVARRLTHSSWPLQHVEPWLVAAAALAYLASFVFRARAWHRLFPRGECPDQARCLASVGAAAASGVVLPFRLDYLIKVGVLRRLGGIRVGLGAIVLSIVSLGMIDAIAMLPLSISATATTNSALRGPLLVVVVFGIACSHAARAQRSGGAPAAAAPEPPPARDRRAGRPAHDERRPQGRRRRLVLPLRLLVDACFRQRRAPQRPGALVLPAGCAGRDLPRPQRPG